MAFFDAIISSLKHRFSGLKRDRPAGGDASSESVAAPSPNEVDLPAPGVAPTGLGSPTSAFSRVNHDEWEANRVAAAHREGDGMNVDARASKRQRSYSLLGTGVAHERLQQALLPVLTGRPTGQLRPLHGRCMLSFPRV